MAIEALTKRFVDTTEGLMVQLQLNRPKTLLSWMVYLTGGLAGLTVGSAILCGLLFFGAAISFFGLFLLTGIALFLGFWTGVTALLALGAASTLGSFTVGLYVATAATSFVMRVVPPVVHRVLLYFSGKDLPLHLSAVTQPTSDILLSRLQPLLQNPQQPPLPAVAGKVLDTVAPLPNVSASPPAPSVSNPKGLAADAGATTEAPDGTADKGGSTEFAGFAVPGQLQSDLRPTAPTFHATPEFQAAVADALVDVTVVAPSSGKAAPAVAAAALGGPATA